MARWTAEVFVDSSVGTINPIVEAGTPHGATQQIERIYGPVTQIVNLRELPPNRGGGSSSVSQPGGCGGVLLLIIGAIVVGAFAGGDDTKRPSERPEGTPKTYIQRSVSTPPEPQWKDYANPPGPCVTADFTPC